MCLPARGEAGDEGVISARLRSRSRARSMVVGLGAIDLGASDAYAVPDVGRL